MTSMYYYEWELFMQGFSELEEKLRRNSVAY